jgi:SHS family lactate transporter-like MFS transporter
LGYLIAAGFNMGIVPNSKHGFKMLYYLGGGLTAAVAVARLFFGESKQFIEARKNNETSGKLRTKLFIADARRIFKEYWKRCIYSILLLMLFIYVCATCFSITVCKLTEVDEVCRRCTMASIDVLTSGISATRVR